MYYDTWPLESGRKFESEYFTEEELWKKCQENGWLKTGGEMFEDNEWAEKDYTFSAYECYSLAELRAAFIYGNWSIRQCFVYKNLAFVNQINAGDEWWGIQKDPDGKLHAFDSITFKAVIQHTESRFIKKVEPVGDDWVFQGDVEREAEALTKTLHETFGKLSGMFYVPYGQRVGGYEIWFKYIDHDYFRNYLHELLEASKLGWWGYREVNGVKVN